MAVSADDTRPRTGRPRDPACDAAILQAALDAFGEDGYAGVSVEGVALRAGVGKATIYRRYASKAELVVEAVRCGVMTDEQLPDTGDLRADLRNMMRPLLERLRGDTGRTLITLAVERVRNPDLAAEFEHSVIGRKRLHLRHLLESAVGRGDLPADTDIELIAEAGPALLWHHALNGLPLDDDMPDRILDVVLPGLFARG